jgi:hypothetical protein
VKRKDEYMNKKTMILAMLLPLFVAFSPVRATDNSEQARLYATRLQSVSVPANIQVECAKNIGASLSSTYVYVVVACDGKPVWISPKNKVVFNQTRFEWPNTLNSTAVLLWAKNSHVSVRVFLSDDTVEASASAAGVGAAGGAGLGALIGGVAAGVFTGGFGAPVGALIGAAIGGGTGAVAGVATGALSANDRILFELECPAKGAFPVNGTLEYSVKSLGEKKTASISFRLLESRAPARQGELELGQKYIVRLRTIELSNGAALKGENEPQKAKYYVVLQQGSIKYQFLENKPISIPPDISINPAIYTVLKNTGESTQVYIYEEDSISDDLVFTSKIGKIDGGSWVFIGKATADDVKDTSYVLFETFGPLK